MKKQKYYIPVIMSNRVILTPEKDKILSKEIKHTMLLANNIKEVYNIIPPKDFILDHLISQQENIKENRFISIKLYITREEYDHIWSLIIKKAGIKAIKQPSIDICLDSNHLPIIQILYKNEKKEE